MPVSGYPPPTVMPVGVVVPYAGASPPFGWLLCAGQTVPRTSYPALFAVIGTTYNTGGEAGSDFRLPDLRGRVPAGLDNMGGADAGRLDWPNTLGAAGGTQTHQLTTSEMPSHQHEQAWNTAYDTGSEGFKSWGATIDGTTAYKVYQVSPAPKTGYTGGAQPHNNMQPTALLNYLIRAE